MDDQSNPTPHASIALIWRGQAGDPPSPKTERFAPVIAALRDLEVRPTVVPFSEDRLAAMAIAAEPCYRPAESTLLKPFELTGPISPAKELVNV